MLKAWDISSGVKEEPVMEEKLYSGQSSILLARSFLTLTLLPFYRCYRFSLTPPVQANRVDSLWIEAVEKSGDGGGGGG